MKRFLLATISILLVLSLKAQNVSSLFENRTEIYFMFKIESPKQIADLTQVVSIDNRDGNIIYAYANKQEFIDFLKCNISYTLLPNPGENFNPKMASFEDMKNSDAWDSYPTYDAYVALMNQFELDYPDICQVFSIGQSVYGKELLVAKISDNVNTDEDEPEFLYTSSMHGDELTGFVLMLRLIDSLLTSYGTSPRITNLVDNVEIYINPAANPDGTYGNDNNINSPTRFNANGVDLNRNFPDMLTGQYPNTQPETFAFMSFAENRHFVISANIHGGAEVCNYPWDRIVDRAADDDWWQYVCHEYADTAQLYSPSGYLSGFNDGITNGYDWYDIDGGRQDYMNFFHQCREFTLEISSTKMPNASSLPNYWNYNKRSFLNYIEQGLYGVRGIVTDAQSGLPLEAEVYVLNHEEDSSWVYSDPVTGNYHRLLNAGIYNIRFSAPCYQDQVFNNVSVANHNTTMLDVQMVIGAEAADFYANKTSGTTNESFYFYDNSCGNPYEWEWTFTGPGNVTFTEGTNENSQNPVVQFDMNGSYTVELSITTASGSFSEIKSNYISIIDCEYCNSYGNMSYEISITLVEFNEISNSSAKPSGYGDYTYISTTLNQNETYDLTVNVNTDGSYTVHAFAWIDWNHDCDFNDSGEAYDLGSVYNTPNGPTSNCPLSIIVPSDAQTGPTRMRVSAKYNSDPSSCATNFDGEVEDYTLIISTGTKELDLTVFLEGPFNGSGMNTDLTNSTNLTISQPYNSAPWNYPGPESMGSIPSGTVDWVLVELHDALNAASVNSGTLLERRAALLMSDGSVADTDGTTKLLFEQTIVNQLFLIIRHRNHLDVLSANPLTETGGTYFYNFSTGEDKAFGGNFGFKDLGGGFWGMVSGDANADGLLDENDGIESWNMESGESGYLNSDVNLNGQSNNQDKNDYWFINRGIYSSQTPN
ncbi:MAG: hypothetical protein JW731_08655 [Bacteroidales bacterium]|nr:hypothetical protein [Bacteroidales bacterium]